MALDPLTAGLQLVTAIVTNHTTMLQGMDAHQRVAYGAMMIADLERWQKFLDLLFGFLNKSLIAKEP